MFAFFERLINAFPAPADDSPPGSLFAFLRYYTRGLEKPLLALAASSAVIAILEVSLFGFLGQLVDWLAEQERDTLLREELGRLLWMGFILLVALPAMNFLHAVILHQTLLGNFPMRVRWLAHRYLLRQSISFYQNEFAGRLSTRVMQTALSVRESVLKLLDILVFVTVYFGAMIVLLASADLWLAVPMLAWLVVYVGIQLFFVPRLKAAATAQAGARAEMTGRIVDSYTNIQTVKLFSHTERESDYARLSMEDFMTTVYRQMRLATGFNVTVSASNYLLVFVIAALSIGLWVGNAISVGAIAIGISLALRLNGMAQWIMWEVGAIFEHLGTVADGSSTLSQPLTVQDIAGARPLDIECGAITLEHVGFAYEAGRPVINDLSLHIGPGERIGLIGASGAGKSTLVNLLLRFHDLQSGSIKIDGQNIREVSQDSLRAAIGMVTQDTSLLHRSIRDNILYGRPNASDTELQHAAQQAQADVFIESLSDAEGKSGYDAMVGERGVKLSGGQRQRIAIARVLLKDAPILILDEATSALDSEVEAAIQENLNRLMAGKTVIAIAHRLSTIAAMDRLIVMDQGRIVEQGTHSELLAAKGVYARLWHRQTGGFLGA